MRQLFMVGAKLLGLSYIVSGLIDGMVLPRMAPSAAPFASQIALACLMHLLAGTVLVFFTGIVATGLRIPESIDDHVPPLSSRRFLEIGIVLIGLFEVFAALPPALRRFADNFNRYAISRDPFELVNVEALWLALSLSLVLFAHRIAGLLERVSRHSSGP